MTGFAILTSFFAIFTEDRFGFDASQNGYIFAGVGAIGVIVQGGLLGPLVSRFGEKRLALAGVALLATSIFSLRLTERIPTPLLTGVGIAVGNALVNPTMSGLVSQTVDKHHQRRVLSLMQSGASLGRCLGPIPLAPTDGGSPPGSSSISIGRPSRRARVRGRAAQSESSSARRAYSCSSRSKTPGTGCSETGATTRMTDRSLSRPRSRTSSSSSRSVSNRYLESSITTPVPVGLFALTAFARRHYTLGLAYRTLEQAS